MAEQTQPALTADEMRRLTTWRWLYNVEALGFTKQEARRLVWARWAVRRGKLGIG